MLTINERDYGVRDHLAHLSGKLADMSGAMGAIGQTLEERIKARFETETDPLGVRWQPWADSTRANYPFVGSHATKNAGKTGNARLLDRYGDMLQSVNHQVLGSDTVRVGLGQPYAVYHEWGAPKNNLPRRGMVFADPDAGTLGSGDKQAVLDVLEAYLDRL